MVKGVVTTGTDPNEEATMAPTRSPARLAPLLALLTVLVGIVGACASSTPSESADAPTTRPTTTTTAAAVIDPGDGGEYRVELDPADFVATIDNPYLPFPVGARWVYEGDGERIEVVVTDERREIMGIDATVVRDTVTDGDGQVVEDTYDWFAQDADGYVWYLGEDSTEYENGEPANTNGSWEAGVDGALPGIVMPAQPAVGDAYRQEYYPGEAEDLAEVRRFEATLDAPTGPYRDVLVTGEWNPLDPEVVEEKYYAEGVGLVREVTVAGGSGPVDLVSFEPGG